MDNFQLKMCDIQGRLFELSAINEYNSEQFISFFMNSNVATALDSKYNRMQWAGEEYLFDELICESKDKIKKDNQTLSQNVLYWIGYLYRYWQYYKNESSKKIIRMAPYKTVVKNYVLFHTLDIELAIDNLIEIKHQKDNPHN